jgi:hypothetical protein
MVPPIIRHKLAALRRRERLLTFAWGLACWLSLALVLVLLAGFVDWLIDRERDTPDAYHVGALGVQFVVAAFAAVWFLLWPQVRWLPDAKLALWVEDKLPHLEHRLISAVQLNQRGANLEGMSIELVKVVTLEAEKEARKAGFAQLADHRRLRWSFGVLLPTALLAALPYALWPDMSWALLQRQVLMPVEIPHSVYLTSVSNRVSPIGDDIEIYYRVSGAFDEDMIGSLSVTPAGQRTDRYPISYKTKDSKGAIFGAKIPSSSADFLYSAHLADGRTRLPSVMKLVPRPVVIENQAWIVLPEFCGKRPDGGRYEQPQGRGDVVGIPGSAVRVALKTQKAITKAKLEIIGPQAGEGKTSEDDMPPPEVVKRELLLTAGSDGFSAEGIFDLKDGETGYRLLVEDEYGFANVPAPRRSMRIVPEDPPQVALLRDTFGIGADFDLEGLPVLLDDRIRIPYVCYGQYGLSKAFILYRVLKKHESGEEPAEDEPWIRLPLTEVQGNNDTGPFDPKTGVFAFTKFDQQVPFHAAPALNPNKDLGRTIGGGRFFLETKGLIDSKGKLLRLKSGDQIEYCVEVHAAHRKPETSIPVARSETRVSTVMQLEDFNAWLRQVGKEDERVKQLESKQKGVLDRN